MVLLRPTPVLLTVLVSVVAIAGPPSDAPAAWETRLDLETAGVLLRTYGEGSPEWKPPEDWTPLDRATRDLPLMYKRRLPTVDGWGRTLLLATIEGEWVVLSRGPDGVRQAFVADSVLGDDIVLIVGEGLHNGPRTTVDRQRATMGDLRALATAVESYAIDNDSYPGSPGPAVDTIGNVIEPTYIRRAPLVDAWGNPFLYWSDGARYAIVSPGADGLFQESWDEISARDHDAIAAVARGETENPDDDIVFADGQFVQWPRGLPQ